MQRNYVTVTLCIVFSPVHKRLRDFRHSPRFHSGFAAPMARRRHVVLPTTLGPRRRCQQPNAAAAVPIMCAAAGPPTTTPGPAHLRRTTDRVANRQLFDYR